MSNSFLKSCEIITSYNLSTTISRDFDAVYNQVTVKERNLAIVLSLIVINGVEGFLKSKETKL